MFPPLPGKRIRDKRLRKERMAERALADLGEWLRAIDVDYVPEPVAEPA